MTTQTNPRLKEIQAIWQQYQGLYVVGGILIGLLLFPLLELIIHDLSELLIGLVPEAIGIGFTVFFLDRIYQRREIESLKKRLIREAGSQSNEIAKAAVDWLRYEKWLTGDDGLLKGIYLGYASLQGANFYFANLQGTDLQSTNLQDTDLMNANLQGADLMNANLLNADLQSTNLQNSKLLRANLQSTKSMFANLQYANLMFANLHDSNLFGANLQNAALMRANLQGSNLEGVTLPDGTKWNPNTDMTRFTDPSHPDFWQPTEQE